MKRFINYLKQLFAIHNVSVSVASTDVGKCTKCRFNNGKYDNCTVGTYYAKKGMNKICYEGGLWQATER